ncbi:ribosomal protein S18 acetylase RimI-like enzyme [Psychromicrobium silvestre]|uniref:Ribosomal protein S18 acetylase RimI-like enzyme n=1 Tax=Psychromicrobium silvestre TaxID=1645614 RepID=A0A7Y9LRW0_9MICC|nr:GNAT family N-acetyltransferase [Psychromicrobium silvestre]NYE94452.1 ribosomal protein S18 acetylase RimI-like enzyme [Psychromicrobium silvestre]
MSSKVILIARTTPLQFELGITTRSPSTQDVEALGKLYFSAYDKGLAEQTLEAATANIEASFGGKYGTLLTDASQLAVDQEGKIIAGILVVERSSHEGTPEAPFLIELFTDRDHRRQGLAERLVLISTDKLFNAGYKEVAVRVKDSNSAALALYLSLDFQRWDAEEED